MDPISDMLVRIKNATDAKKESVVFPVSKLKLAIADALFKAGFIQSFGKKGKKIAKFIEVGLIYEDGQSKIKGVERVSKTSKSGYGALILSTPKGIMTDKMAREANVGGEALFKIW